MKQTELDGPSEGAAERVLTWLDRNGKHLDPMHVPELRRAILAVIDEAYRAGRESLDVRR